MKKQLRQIFLFMGVVLSSSMIGAQPASLLKGGACDELDLLNPVKMSWETSLAITKAIEEDLSSRGVTGLRGERKFTVNADAWESVRTYLESRIGPLKSRDHVTSGTKNLTRTLYLGKVRLKYLTRKGPVRVSGKLRLREYLVEELSTGNLGRSAVTDENIFLEFKIDYPNPRKVKGLKNVVNKPRILIPRASVDSLFRATPNIDRYIASLAQTIKGPIIGESGKTLYINDPVLVDNMLEAVKLMHHNGEIAKLENSGPVETTYERAAFEILVPSREGSSLIQVQITVDKNISYRIPATREVIGRYQPHERVVEIKIPLEQVELKPRDLRRYPQLGLIRDVVGILDQFHLPQYQKDSGKTGALGRQ